MKQTYPATLNNLHAMLEFVRAESKAAGLSEKAIGHVELAAEETLINIIKHSYPDRSPSEAIVEIISEKVNSPSGIKLTILDQGIAFDPLTSAPPVSTDLSIDEMPIGGYGIFLIRKMIDQVAYRRINNFNELTLTKFQS